MKANASSAVSHAHQDLIDHLNYDHADELVLLAHSHGKPQATRAQLQSIDAQGCRLCLDDDPAQTLDLAFAGNGRDIEAQIRYLVYDALIRQGRWLGGKQRYFTVAGCRQVTPNIIRLSLHSRAPLPVHEAGLAWYFDLKTRLRLPERQPQTDGLPRWRRWVLRLWWWWLRHQSPARRNEKLQQLGQGKRYYTCRSIDGQTAEVDVFVHGDSAGSRWAQNLRTGDIIASVHEYREQTEFLQQGHAVLIGDETALPTLAALLANWRNPQAPSVCLISRDAADQAYLPDSILPAGSRINRLHGEVDIHDITAWLDRLPRIDAAWGALGEHQAAALRRHLRQQHNLDGARNRIKAYWRNERAT